MDYTQLRITRFSGPALTQGIEECQFEGVLVRVTYVARTVADYFKFCNKIGLDVAMEALREAGLAERVSMDELWHYANLCPPDTLSDGKSALPSRLKEISQPS